MQSEKAKYDFNTIASHNAFREAEANNLEIKLPFPDQLFIDIDSKEAAEAYARNITKFKNHVVEVVGDSCTQSKSKGRILYQLFLGSDRTRETLSYIRLINGDPNPTLFFEKKPDMLTAGPVEYAGDNS